MYSYIWVAFFIAHPVFSRFRPLFASMVCPTRSDAPRTLCRMLRSIRRKAASVTSSSTHHLGINLFTAIEFLQGIPGLGIPDTLSCCPVLPSGASDDSFQPQIPLIDHIDFRGHAVDAMDQNYCHCKYLHQISIE